MLFQNVKAMHAYYYFSYNDAKVATNEGDFSLVACLAAMPRIIICAASTALGSGKANLCWLPNLAESEGDHVHPSVQIAGPYQQSVYLSHQTQSRAAARV